METLIHGEWKEFVDPSSQQRYYFNVRTGATQWTIPEEATKQHQTLRPSEQTPSPVTKDENNSQTQSSPATIQSEDVVQNQQQPPQQPPPQQSQQQSQQQLAPLDNNHQEEHENEETTSSITRKRSKPVTGPTPPIIFAGSAKLQNTNGNDTHQQETETPTNITSVINGVATPTSETMSQVEDVWKECKDQNSGRIYYYNTKTGESSWTKPEETKIAVVPPENPTLTLTPSTSTESGQLTLETPQQEVSHTRTSSYSSSEGKGTITVEPLKDFTEVEVKVVKKKVLKELWKEYHDTNYNKTYYYCAKTGETSWTKPETLYEEVEVEEEDEGEKQHKKCLSVSIESSRKNATSGQFSPVNISDSGEFTERFRKTLCRANSSVSGSRMSKDSATVSSGTPEQQLPMLARNTKTLVNYATQNCAKPKKTGLFGLGGTSFDKLVSFQTGKLSQPLHIFSNNIYVQKSVESFDLIQAYMGDANTLAKRTKFDIAKDLLQLVLLNPTLRSEVALQICKQINNHPKPENQLCGLQLLCLYLLSFAPNSIELSESILNFLQNLQGSKTQAHVQLPQFLKLAEKRLRQIVQTGSKKSIPSDKVIMNADTAKPTEPIFAVTVQDYMDWQMENVNKIFQLHNNNLPPGSQNYPLILVILAKALEEAGGYQTEGIFRLPGSSGEVDRIRDKLQTGVLKVDIPADTRDPHVIASLLKLWLRQLVDPVIPLSLYQKSIDAATQQNAAEACQKIVDNEIPQENRRVLNFVVDLLSKMSQPAISSKTMMNVDNLSLVFAPNILRTTDLNPLSAMKNAPTEQKFVKQLIQNRMQSS